MIYTCDTHKALSTEYLTLVKNCLSLPLRCSVGVVFWWNELHTQLIVSLFINMKIKNFNFNGLKNFDVVYIDVDC